MHFIPAPLSRTESDFQEQFTRLATLFHHFQIDVQDGIFVPSTTINVSSYMRVIHRYIDTHPSYRCTIDYHLMLTDYTDELRMIAEMPHPHVQVRTIFVHTNIPQKLLNDALSLTFNVEDSVRDWAAHLTHASYAQVMTIHPGPQGQAFIPSQLSKIGEIRKINPLCKICIDGSVNEQTITSIRSAVSSCVPDECGVGSYFSRATSDELPIRLHALQSKH